MGMAKASWPIEDFLASGQLYLGDILLFRRKRSLFSRGLTAITGDYFAHCAMIFATPETDTGFKECYVLECNFSGVVITPLEHFIRKRRAYVICVKRLERDWMDERLRKRIRGHALNYIAADYSFGTVTNLFLRAEAHALFPKWRHTAHRARMLRQALRQGLKFPMAFICSGFVQYAYFDAVRREVLGRGAVDDESVLSDCYFAKDRRTDSLEADLLSVTPQEIADTSKLNWKFLIQQGEVIEVASEQGVREIVGKNYPDRRDSRAAGPPNIVDHLSAAGGLQGGSLNPNVHVIERHDA